MASIEDAGRGASNLVGPDADDYVNSFTILSNSSRFWHSLIWSSGHLVIWSFGRLIDAIE